MAYPPPDLTAHVDGEIIEAADITALDDGIQTIVTELGASPKGASADLTARLAAVDVLVAAINSALAAVKSLPSDWASTDPNQLDTSPTGVINFGTESALSWDDSGTVRLVLNTLANLNAGLSYVLNADGGRLDLFSDPAGQPAFRISDGSTGDFLVKAQPDGTFEIGKVDGTGGPVTFSPNGHRWLETHADDGTPTWTDLD